MLTDGGSIPSVAWTLGLDPWIYMPAYIIHDWEFMQAHVHHAKDLPVAKSFDEVNNTLAEGILTLMLNKKVPENWWNLTASYCGVSSHFGRCVWNRPWTLEQLRLVLPDEDL